MLREVILPNVPPTVKCDLKTLGGEALDWSRVRSILTSIFTKMNIESNRRKPQGGKPQGKPNYNGKSNNQGGYHQKNGDHKKERQENYKSQKSKKKDKKEESESDDESSVASEESRMISRKKISKTKNEKKKSNICAILIDIKNDSKTYLALLDTGTSASLASEDVVKECCCEKKKKKTEWNTQGGPFKTTHRATVTKMVLPQFTKNRKVDFRMHLFKKTRGDKYDFILGCDFL